MSYPNKRGFGGGNKFGGGGFNRGPKEMHDATCASCGTACQVPFRPNGKKPVYCSQCFQKEGGNERPSFPRNDRPSFDRPAQSGGNNAKLEAQMNRMEEKLDALIEALTGALDEMECDEECGDDCDGMHEEETASVPVEVIEVEPVKEKKEKKPKAEKAEKKSKKKA